jgi:hypothetical protein
MKLIFIIIIYKIIIIYTYYPVFFLHGFLGDEQNFRAYQKWTSEEHPTTKIFSLKVNTQLKFIFI